MGLSEGHLQGQAEGAGSQCPAAGLLFHEENGCVTFFGAGLFSLRAMQAGVEEGRI